ncbi:2,' 3'-cyclic nucleotide 2'-phosphodiesterase [Rossellomorea vietnamensis]|uniref:2,' 3'-cyclic nucleotide 2'-phosphodiesterase n=1 Tax=Rossellomorea vietnamensis TaxID=218284 RepID=A0A5D4KG40_9BACI|nr:5'-nucleotidase C-terminal domain-containing protein [Rossellomorea vietnamensis]TYR75223.1 2,' 3'-cyclic nucleotide 2'-phosphodiesterase [Rossellomorea vietnamensis]
MLRKVGKRVVSFALVSAMAAGAFATPFSTDFVKAETENIKVQLLGLNDLHGFYNETYTEDVDGDKVEETVGGLDYITTYMKEREAENANTLYVHSGDMIGGSPLYAAAFQDENVVEILEAMGFDIGTVGNHEFDEGTDELLRMVNGGEHANGTENYDGMDFSMIAANVEDAQTGELLLDPYKVVEIGGAEIGFIGVATTETPSMVVKKGNENLKVTNEVDAINKYTQELKDQGVKAVVVLAHNPVNQEGNSTNPSNADFIANNVDDEVDVIFAAHNHEMVDRTVDGKLIVQASDYGKAFSDVDLEIDPATGDIVSKEAELVVNVQEGVTPDPEIKSIIDSYDKQVEEIADRVAGTAAFTLEGGYGTKGPLGDNAMGNLIADGMAWSMDADIALMNGGGIRNDVEAGEITYGDLFAVQPFGNVLTKFTLKGSELREVMNTQINPKYGPDFSISGFTYTWNADTNKVEEMFTPSGEILDETKEYSIVVNHFMFDREQYRITEFFKGEEEYGDVDVEATYDYVQSLDGEIEYYAEGRFQEVKDIFTDVSVKDWENPYVTDLYNQEIVKGTTATTFSPDEKLTRIQFTSMLVRALGLSSDEATPFKDLGNVSSIMNAELNAAYEAGITYGTSDTTFSPHKEITREQMVTMIVRAFEVATGEELVSDQVSSFEDIDALTEEAYEAINATYKMGIIHGYNETTFKPLNSSTRAEAAKVLSLFLQQ